MAVSRVMHSTTSISLRRAASSNFSRSCRLTILTLIQQTHQRGFASSFQSWRHAGEDGALAIYVKGVRWILLLLCCMLILLFFVLYDKKFILVIAVVTVPRTALELRRAIIFTDAEVLYRPPFGPLRCVLVTAIRELRRSPVFVSVFVRASRSPGLVITLSGGATEAWPLDFRDREEILGRLSAITGKAIEG